MLYNVMNDEQRERRRLGGNVSSRSKIVTRMSNMLKVISFMAFLPIAQGAVLAQSSLKTAWKASGEVVSASKTTINGFSAISGATVFNSNRIRTGKDGAAIINLGRLGRIELGPETDMTLRISEASIGGELRSNHMVVSARTGISITVNTAEGIVTTDGRQPAVLSIYLDGKRPRVITHRGSANVVITSEKDLERGKELAPAPRRVTLARAGVTAAVIGASLRPTSGRTVTVTPSQAAAVTPSAPTFTSLFKAGINYSRGPRFNGPGSEEPFESSITCRDNDQRTCHKKSSHKPERP
jgi:hypothetical protein